MDRLDKINLDEVVEFFDPYPGFADAMIPIPEPVRRVAADLDGKSMTLRAALKLLRDLTLAQCPGTNLELVPEYRYIKLHVNNGPGHPEHIFRIIRYR